jgi:hypothetical protein
MASCHRIGTGNQARAASLDSGDAGKEVPEIHQVASDGCFRICGDEVLIVHMLCASCCNLQAHTRFRVALACDTE